MSEILCRKVYTLDCSAKELLPYRDPMGHKGTFGKLLLIAGSTNMCGAALLAARAAYRTGAGMVKVISPESNRIIIQLGVPEALYMPSESSDDEWQKAFEWCDCIAIGPGLGMDEGAKNSVKKVDAYYKVAPMASPILKPLVVDADGLNIMAQDTELFSDIKNMVMTPHPGELMRLAMSRGFDADKTGAGGLSEDTLRMKAALLVSEQFGAVIASKSALTYVVNSQSDRIFMNDRGTHKMGTAGSGDVLTGIISGLLAQGMDTFTAAVNGVRLHALAGEKAADALGTAGLLAGDVIDYIGVE